MSRFIPRAQARSEMGLLKRQSYTYAIFDDQSPELMMTYVGNWTHIPYPGAVNNTVTYTSNPGATFSLTFTGTQAFLVGGVLPGIPQAEWPSANYVTDGDANNNRKPYNDTQDGLIIYFQTLALQNGTHTINVTVTGANDTNLYVIDYFLVLPSGDGDNTGIQTTRAAPSASATVVIAQSTPVGPIVGGVVGGIAGIVLVVFLLWFFLRKRLSGGGRAYYFDKPDAADVLAGEAQVEPFNATPTTSPPPSAAAFNRPAPQSMYSDSSSHQPLNPTFARSAVSSYPSNQSGPSEAGMTYVSGTSAQPRTGKAALIAQQYENVQPPVQFQDSGIRFNENGEQEAGPSQLPTEVPPTYTPN